jgi:hypothetical protein
MHKEAAIETLLVVGVSKVFRKNVFTKRQKYVILTKVFKRLSISGKNCCMDWIEINPKKSCFRIVSNKQM